MSNNHYQNSSYYSSSSGGYYSRDSHYSSHYYSQDGRAPSYHGSEFDYSNSSKVPSGSWSREAYYYEPARLPKSYSSDSYLNDPYYLPKRSEYPTATSPLEYAETGRKYDYNYYPSSSSGYRASSPDRYSNLGPATSYGDSYNSTSHRGYADGYFRSGYFGAQTSSSGYDARLTNNREYEAAHPYRSDQRWPSSKLDESRSFRRWGRLDDYASTAASNNDPTSSTGLPTSTAFDSPQKRSSFYWRNWDNKLSTGVNFRSKKLLSPIGTAAVKFEGKPTVSGQTKKTQVGGQIQKTTSHVIKKEGEEEFKTMEELVPEVEVAPVEQISDPKIELLVKNCLNILDYKIKLALIPLNMSWDALQKNLEEMKIEEAPTVTRGDNLTCSNEKISTKIVKDSGMIESKVEKNSCSDQPVGPSLKRPSELDLSQATQKKKVKPTDDNSGRSLVGNGNGQSLPTPNHALTPNSKTPTNLPPTVATTTPRTKEESRSRSKSREAGPKTNLPTNSLTQQTNSNNNRKPSQSTNPLSVPQSGALLTPRTSNPDNPPRNKVTPREIKVPSVPLNSQTLDTVRNPVPRTPLSSRDQKTDYPPKTKPLSTNTTNAHPHSNQAHLPAQHRPFSDSGSTTSHPMDVEKRRGATQDWNHRDWRNPVDWTGNKSDWRAPAADYSRGGEWNRGDGRNGYDPAVPLSSSTSKYVESELPRSTSYDWRDERYRYDYPSAVATGGVPINAAPSPYYKYDDNNNRYPDNYSRRRDDPYYSSNYPQSYPTAESSYGRSWDATDRSSWNEVDRSKLHYDHPSRASQTSSQNGNLPPSSYPPGRDNSGNNYYDRKYY